MYGSEVKNGVTKSERVWSMERDRWEGEEGSQTEGSGVDIDGGEETKKSLGKTEEVVSVAGENEEKGVRC